MHFCWSISRLFFFTLMSASSFSWHHTTLSNSTMWAELVSSRWIGWGRANWETKLISEDSVFYLVCLKVLQRLIAFNQLFLEVLDGFLQLAHLLRQLPVGRVVTRLHLRPLFEETHERVAFSVPCYISFPLGKGKVGGSKVKGGGVGELWLEQGTNRNQQACLWTMEIM